MPRIEQTALSNLIHNEEYTRKVLPFIKEEYFADKLEGLLFAEIYRFVDKYNNLPTKESLSIEMNSNKSVNEDEYKKITDILSTLDKEPVNLEWLLETTEKFCKDRAIHNAILGGIQILDGNVLVPLLFSEAVNLHPIAIILAVLFFGGVWGFWGIFFAIPLATLIKAILNAWPTRHDVIAGEGSAEVDIITDLSQSFPSQAEPSKD